MPSAWLSLDESDSDLDLFLSYFIAALRTIFVEACDQTLMLLQAGQQPPQAVLVTMFCNDLEKLPGEVILVLDDYQLELCKSARNLRNLDFIVGRELNAYQVLWADKLVVTTPALEQIKEMFGA